MNVLNTMLLSESFHRIQHLNTAAEPQNFQQIIFIVLWMKESVIKNSWSQHFWYICLLGRASAGCLRRYEI